MGATAAELGIIVDTSTVKAAVKDLQDLSASGKATSADVTKASKGVVTAFAGLAGEARKAGDETFKLASKFTPAIAAAAKMEKEFEDLQKALDTNAITLAQYQQHLDAMATRATRALGLTATATDKVVAANEKAAVATEKVAAAATRAVPSVQKMTQGTVKVSEAANRSTGNMRMFGQQLSQVAQQGAATGQWAQAFAIQAADIGLAFGPVGMAIGAVLTVLPSLVMGFMEAGSGADELDDSLSSLAEAMSHLRNVQGDINGDFSDLTREFGINAAAAKELLEIQRQLAEVRATRAFDKAATGVTGILGGELYSNANVLGDQIEQIKALYAEREALIEQSAIIEQQLMDGATIATPPENLGLAVSDIEQQIAAIGGLSTVMDRLTNEYHLSADAAGQLVLAATEVNGATDLSSRVDAAQNLARVLDEVTAGFIGGTDEAYELYQQLLDAVTAGLQLEGMDYASSISAGADQASRLADEMQRAVNNAISLAAQGISNLRQSELRLQYRNDPVGLAGAMAREEFGDVSGFDPILRGELEKQRDAFIANAEATEANKQALIEWQKAQAAAASGSGRRGGGGGGGSRGGASEAAKELQQLMREGESITKSVMTAQEEYSAAIAQAARLLDVGAISQETYNRHVDQLGVELQEAQFGDLIGQVQDFTESLIRAGIEGKNALEVIGDALLDVGVKMASSGLNNLIMNAIGFGGSGSGTGTLGLPSFDGGGYTGKSSRSGGLDGKGGFMAMLHPQETVIDHSKGQGGAQTITLNINSDPSVIVSVAEATADTKIKQNNAVRDRAFNGKARAAVTNTRKV